MVSGLVLTEQQVQYRNKIVKLKDFNEVFELVKSAILTKFKMHRAGLSIILQMPL